MNKENWWRFFTSSCFNGVCRRNFLVSLIGDFNDQEEQYHCARNDAGEHHDGCRNDYFPDVIGFLPGGDVLVHFSLLADEYSCL
jgi:hypothetical protein